MGYVGGSGVARGVFRGAMVPWPPFWVARIIRMELYEKVRHRSPPPLYLGPKVSAHKRTESG